MTKRILSLLLCLVMALSLTAGLFTVPAHAADTPQIKNIIYMIPDGGGMAPFYLADYVKHYGGFNKEYFPNATPVTTDGMYIKEYLVGAETTNNVYNKTTDSAAAGTALATGCKTVNEYIGIDAECKPRANILEACQDLGKNTGIVITYEWTNATPASFSAHDISRGNAVTMSEQIVNQEIDVVLGASSDVYTALPWFADEHLNSLGYTVIHNENQLNEVKAGDKLWGKLPNAYFDVYREASTPGLPQLVTAAITALNDDNENGFFLMVEGSAVDGGGHANNTIQNVSEFIAFDEACKIAIEFAKTRTDTIVVIAPDHDTGGLYYEPEHLYDIVYDTQNALNSRWAHWETSGHTSRNGGVFLYVPEGVPYPAGIDPDQTDLVAKQFFTAYGNFTAEYPQDAVNVIDNTDIVKYIASLIDVDLDTMTDKLFVDVTDMGSYNAETEVFAFHDKDLTIKRNASTAYFEEEAVDLNGEIAVYIEGRFYVPAQVLTIGEAPEEPEIPEVPEEPEIHVCPSEAFEDLDTALWYHTFIDYALDKGLMSGISANRFAPNNTLTRAMLVTILYSLEGKPQVEPFSTFADVTEADWFAAPVFWAQQNGIVSGTSATAFSPNANITREQIAVILCKYAQYKGMNTLTLDQNLNADDANEISDYAISAMNWAVGKGIITGKSESTLNPKDNATRAEIAAMLCKFIETIK